MKVECVLDTTIIYLYQELLDYDNLDALNKKIKNIFIDLIKKYHLDFYGYSLVHIYENVKYGSILEIEKIYSNEFHMDIIDLKLVVHRNACFYLELDDYYDFMENYKFIIKKNKYYLNLDDITNIYNCLEYGKIVYKIPELVE